MRMASHSEKNRRLPQQARATQRVADLLRAGADAIAETGYDNTTMTSVAERAGCSIGALYQYFKNKEEIAHALRVQYGDEMAAQWDVLTCDAHGLSIGELVGRMFDLMLMFMQDKPAYLPLLAAPIAYQRDPAARHRLREHLSAVLLQKNPAIAADDAYRLANVVLQIVKSMNALYADATATERLPLVAEFKHAVTLYLQSRLIA
jgi:AcrR family transcriptional regulator